MQTLSLIAALADRENRYHAALRLAREMGAEDLLIFVRDPEIDAMLPAPGFPQTLPDGRSWQAFLKRCTREGSAAARLPFPVAGSEARAAAIKGPDGSVLVLLDGPPRIDPDHPLCHLLPLIISMLHNEQTAIVARSQATLARAAAAQARTLAKRLDHTRAELQRMVREAEAASRAKEEFLAVVSHELRTPLTSILGWARLLQGRQFDESRLRRALTLIAENAKAQTQLIDDILDFGRIITGKMRLEIRPVDLGRVILDTIEVIRPTAEVKLIQLETVLDPAMVSVAGDPSRLQQVLWNLLSNAVKFTPGGGKIEVRLERATDQAEVVVSDSGPGIQPAFLPYIFDRFSQADSTTTRHHGGIGLGLAIVRHLVEMHGGTISAANREEGQGAIFIVRLPLLNSQEGTIPAGSATIQNKRAQDNARHAPPSGLQLDGLRVLVVENEPATCDFLKHLLISHKAKPVLAPSTLAALAALEAMHFDLLLSSVDMPGEDGYGLIQQIRNSGSERVRRIPAIALIAQGQPGERERAFAAGYHLHLNKPVEPAELLQLVALVAELRQL